MNTCDSEQTDGGMNGRTHLSIGDGTMLIELESLRFIVDLGQPQHSFSMAGRATGELDVALPAMLNM